MVNSLLMKKTIIALCAVLAFSACQKEIELGSNTPGNTSNTSNNNNNGGTSTDPDYQPVSANSKWTMKSTSLGDYTITSLGTDTTVNGQKYYKFDQSIGNRIYINKNNGVYTQLMFTPQLGGWVSLVQLKDAAVGTTWTQTLTSQGISVQMKYTVKATGATHTVNNKAYPNVIKVSYEQSALGMVTATGDQYYAKGVGPIEAISRAEMMGMSMTVDSTYLVSAIIN